MNRSDLRGAELSGADLSHCNLVHSDLSDAELSNANFTCADLPGAGLLNANLTNANLMGAELSSANLALANISDARLFNANFFNANLSGTIISRTDLTLANFTNANLSNAKLSNVVLNFANLVGAKLHRTSFECVIIGSTVFAGVNIGQVLGLESVIHSGPSHIATSCLEKSFGKIPEVFLRGCGFSPWEILAAKLYDTSLSPADIAEIQQLMFNERTKGYFMSGMFISYSREDDAFVQHLYRRLIKEGANVWLDTHNAIAGPLEKQIQRAIRLNDVVLLVLSESSINSDWVEAELDWTRTREQSSRLDILCPIALDGSWKSKSADSVLWRTIKHKNILDFSAWQSEEGFSAPFQKLIDGIRVYYCPSSGQ